jgi:hypothetical protein
VAPVAPWRASVTPWSGWQRAGALPYYERYFREFARLDLDHRFGLPFESLYLKGPHPVAYPTPTTMRYRVGRRRHRLEGYVASGGNHAGPAATRTNRQGQTGPDRRRRPSCGQSPASRERRRRPSPSWRLAAAEASTSPVRMQSRAHRRQARSRPTPPLSPGRPVGRALRPDTPAQAHGSRRPVRPEAVRGHRLPSRDRTDDTAQHGLGVLTSRPYVVAAPLALSPGCSRR